MWTVRQGIRVPSSPLYRRNVTVQRGVLVRSDMKTPSLLPYKNLGRHFSEGLTIRAAANYDFCSHLSPRELRRNNE